MHVKRDAFPDAFPISHEHELKIPQILGPLWLYLAPILDVELPKYKIRDLDSAEIFAGKMAITKASWALGLNNTGYDKVLDTEQNIITKRGFKIALRLILRVKPGGSVWFAPECKTWVFLNSAGNKRTEDLCSVFIVNIPLFVLVYF